MKVMVFDVGGTEIKYSVMNKQPLLLESLRSAYDGLFTSRAGQAYMEGLPRCQIVPCSFSSEANQVGVAAAYFEAMQKKC